jgi:hypothetical protein
VLIVAWRATGLVGPHGRGDGPHLGGLRTLPQRTGCPDSKTAASTKTRGTSSPMYRLTCLPRSQPSRRQLGNTTPTDPRSRRIRASLTGGPCTKTSLGFHRSTQHLDLVQCRSEGGRWRSGSDQG